MTEKKKNSQKLYKILAILFFAGFLICVGILGFLAGRQRRQEAAYDKLAEQTTAEQVTETETETTETGTAGDILKDLGVEIPEKNLDWEALKKENSDIYAWIYIPNTQVDYPIVQHATDDDYYLRHNLDGSSGYPGAIYSQKDYNSKDFTDSNTVLYGHNMKNGSMFGSLHEFEDNAFFDENPFIYIYTPEKTFVYQIYAACEAGDKHLLHAYNFDTESGFDQFITDINHVRDMRSHVRSGIGAVYGRKLLTLSTCIKGEPESRWIVVGVLLNE